MVPTSDVKCGKRCMLLFMKKVYCYIHFLSLQAKMAMSTSNLYMHRPGILPPRKKVGENGPGHCAVDSII